MCHFFLSVVSQADFQQTNNYDEFIVKIRSIVESSDTSGRFRNKAVKEGGVVNRVGSNSNRRNQRNNGNSNMEATSVVPAIAKCDRVVVPAASHPTSGSGLHGYSTGGHVPNCLRSVVDGNLQHNADRQQGTTDEPTEWVSSSCSQDTLKLNFLPPSNSQSTSLYDRPTATSNSLLNTNVREQHHMRHEMGMPSSSSSPAYNNHKIGGENPVDDMLASSFGLSFLLPELMSSSQEHEPEPRQLGMQQVVSNI